MRTRSRRGMVPLRTNGFDENGDGELDRYTHHKYMTISGNYGRDTSTNLLLTRSSNWAGIGASSTATNTARRSSVAPLMVHSARIARIVRSSSHAGR